MRRAWRGAPKGASTTPTRCLKPFKQEGYHFIISLILINVTSKLKYHLRKSNYDVLLVCGTSSTCEGLGVILLYEMDV